MNLFSEKSLAENTSLNSGFDFKEIVDISPYPILIHHNGFLKYANEMARRLINISEEELADHNITKYIHPDDLPRLSETVSKNYTNRISDILDFRVIDTLGQIKWVQSKSTPISFAGEQCRLVHLYQFDGIKLAVQGVKAKEVLLDKLVDILPDSIIVTNSVTQAKIYDSRSFAKYLGYTLADYEGRNEFDFIEDKIHSADFNKFSTAKEFINDPFNLGKLISTEFRVQSKSGEWRWILSRGGSLMQAEDGIGLINVIMIQDITEIRRNQEDLVNYHIFQEKINATSPVLVTVFDVAEQTSIYRSQDMAQWFRYTEGSLPARTIDLVHPEYKEDTIESIKKAMLLKDGEIQSTVYPFLTGDGGIKFILSRSTVFQRDEAGTATHLLIAHSDVTDLKEIESKLDKSEETRKAILYAIPDMVMIINSEGIIMDFYPNEMLRDEIGAMHFIGKDIRKITDPDGYEAIMGHIRDAIAQNKLTFYHYEYKGEERSYHFELRISPFSEGEVIILARDISDQKITQDKIDHYNKELYQKNQELERYITSNSELEKFAYIASHDLREPLRSLTGFAQLLQKRNHGKLTKESEDFIDNIIQGAQRMNTLISGLLEYSRITSAGKPFTSVNLGDLLKKVKSDLKIAIEENNTEFILFDLPDIYCDELQMRQLFQNLISNAIKFRAAADPIIKISAEKTDRHWLFRIEDNGIGIDMKYKDQIFQIFSRLHSQDKYQGSGIGLSVCKKILERHGGRIWLESTPGQGATILFTILAE